MPGDSTKSFNRAVCLSDGIAKIPQLRSFTGASRHQSTWGLNFDWQLRNADLLVDWGNKRFEITSRLQAANGIAVLSLEDGFIRSLGLGVEGSRSFSLVSDWTGIYYDARRPSDLEKILNGLDSRSSQLAKLKQRAHDCINRILDAEISKYNNAPEIELETKTRRRIMLVDQTAGDLSISAGMASANSFRNMLNDALAEDCELVIKTHPDVLTGKKQGYLASDNLPAEVRLIAEPSNPINLIKQVDEVWVVTSQMGFEACIAGKKVRCYGMPFYAGWGITEDQLICSRRASRRSIEEIFAAAYLIYSSYFHPITGEFTELEVILEHINRQKKFWKLNRGHIICLGFDRWKHSYVRNYLASDQNRVEFKRHLRLKDITENTRILIWGENTQSRDIELAKEHRLPVARMEDGFIRSIGLGKYGVPPRSLVIDSGGIYFDPESHSDLERILQSSSFSSDELKMAKRLSEIIISGGLSKYNLGSTKPLPIDAKKGQKVILVPGQVGIDASIAKGCDAIDSNIKLLKAVRAANPKAYILYKSHPDVVSGNIKETGNYQDYADHIEEKAHIHNCLQIADEVHTMTSLVGFEAILRGIQVHTYGRPFYAGWGLTQDHSALIMPQRKRKLHREELIAGVYLKYPRYIDPQNGEFTTAEQTSLDLVEELKKSGSVKLSGNLFYRWLLKIRYGGWGVVLSLLERH